MQKFKVGSLFAGVGGICLGFKNAKFEDYAYSLSWANEIDQYACETYRTNFEHSVLEGDINKILDISLCREDEKERYEQMQNEILSKNVDILTAGFPCQAFTCTLLLTFGDLYSQYKKARPSFSQVLLFYSINPTGPCTRE